MNYTCDFIFVRRRGKTNGYNIDTAEHNKCLRTKRGQISQVIIFDVTIIAETRSTIEYDVRIADKNISHHHFVGTRDTIQILGLKSSGVHHN